MYDDTGNIDVESKVFEKTWQIISINTYLQTTAENSPTQFSMICCTVFFVQECDFINISFSDSQYTLCMVIILKMKLG